MANGGNGGFFEESLEFARCVFPYTTELKDFAHPCVSLKTNELNQQRAK
jgi:hypothetical protein